MRWTFSNGGADRGATKSTRSAFAQSGFGLIELLIVLIVIGILMATVTPIYAKQRDRSKDAVLRENGHNVRAALALYLAQGLNTTYRRSDNAPTSATAAANAAIYVSNGWRSACRKGRRAPMSTATGTPTL